MTTLLLPLVLLAAAGLVLSVVVHLVTLLGLPNPIESSSWALLGAGFVVWVPTVVVGNKMSRDGSWKAALSRCPVWLGVTSAVFFVYGQVALMVEVFGAPEGSAAAGISALCMVFNSAGLVTLDSLRRAEQSVRRCLAGHEVPPGVGPCEICGLPVR